MLSTESRMRGDMQVRFGGRYGKTYCRKAVRRSVPSLRLGKGGGRKKHYRMLQRDPDKVIAKIMKQQSIFRWIVCA